MTHQTLKYLHGLNNYFESEAIPEILPKGCNSPQKVKGGLYAEQLSGSAFTTKRHHNLHSWLYRIRPSVLHSEFSPYQHPYIVHTPSNFIMPPTQLRWDPMPYSTSYHFIDSFFPFAHNGSYHMHQGAAIYLYCARRSMTNECFYNADGELLIVPQEGDLYFKTEFGFIHVAPGEIIVIPRGIKFSVALLQDKARGYICENFGLPFRLPELGIIGANGLAHPRDFQIPSAAFENNESPYQLITKFQGNLWKSQLNHSPFDVVAWHGTYVPYKYDLNRFNTINTVSFDHPDPSIFTVLTSPSGIDDIANVDFVIFPPRWMVAKDTFRLPYFHRNMMCEYMGLIHGVYDAKENHFLPGGSSLHNCMSAHGPDAHAYQKAVSVDLEPEYYANMLAFMFESKCVWQVTPLAYHADFRQKNYLHCWRGLQAQFNTMFETESSS